MVKRRSSKGNPYHYPKGPRGGQFAPKGAGEEYRQSQEYYTKQTQYRMGEITKKEYLSYKENNKPVKVSFTPAETKQEAIQFAENLGVKPFFNDLDLGVCNTLNQSVSEMFKEFPKTKEQVKVIGSARAIIKERKQKVRDLVYEFYKKKYPWANDYSIKRTTNKYVDKRISKRVFAEVKNDTIPDIPNYSGIYINDTYGSNPEFFVAQLKHCVKTGFHPEGTDSVKSVIDHECGHVIDNAYQITEGTGSEQSTNFYRASFLGRKEIKEGLSEYALYNTKEFLAEAWSEYKNNPHPREIATKIGKIIESYRG